MGDNLPLAVLDKGVLHSLEKGIVPDEAGKF
jgi:hypothetical protein